MKLEWMSQASCKNKTRLFFLSGDETAAERRRLTYSAKAICKSCPVLFDCREYARANNELGIWGGETEEERFMAGYLNNPAVNKRLSRMRRRLDIR